MPSIRIVNLIEAIHPKAKLKNIGVRPGEKINELLISEDESSNTYEFTDHFIIMPSPSILSAEDSKKSANRKKVENNFEYSSNNNKFLRIEEIKKLISMC
jgi:FlaA1/EpsC-like NDP-sugar epimerase